MIDMPPDSPPAYEQVLTEKLQQCGLRSEGFIVQYVDYLQSVEVVIDKEADVSAESFDCIGQAAGHEIVTFRDPDLQKSYQDRRFEAQRPAMLAETRAELEKRGVLAGFPERSKFDSDKLFAEALERQCSVTPGAFFVQSGSGLIARPKLDQPSQEEQEGMSCLMAATMYVFAKGEDFDFGFIGNEQFASEE